MSGHRTYEQCATLAIVVVGHLLLIAAFQYLTKRNDDTNTIVDTQRRSLLILIEPEPVQPAVADAPREQSAAAVQSVIPADVEKVRPSTAITAPPSASPEPEAPPPQAPIDWHAQGERAARITAEKLGQSEHRPFGQPRQRSRPADQPRQFEWDSEPDTIGFSGLLPYVRIGKRCVVGLGFFGCAIGKLPEANGDLFEGMRDPDRPQSSVPDSH